MALRVTEEDRKIIKDEFLFHNGSVINDYSQKIIQYAKSKTKLSDKKIVDEMFPNLEKIEEIAGSILFTLYTSEEGEKPLQSIAGMIAGHMATSDKLQDKANAMWIAMELLMVSDPYAKFSYSRNGHPMIQSMIANRDYRIKNIYLPLERPTDQHKELGSYRWKLKRDVLAIEAMDKLNHTKLKVVALDEEPEEKPDDKDFSEAAQKQRELYNKQINRQYLADLYKDKTIYFNWAADYRGRMYSVGYYLNPQGTQVEKEMIQLGKGEKLTFKGLQRLKKSIASAYGLDKKTDLEKLEWFIKNEKTLHLRKRNAKEPYTFQALYKAYKQYKADPEAKITTMVELDATNSQAQILSVLTHSRKAAETCNVVPKIDENGEFVIADLYKLVADRMSDIIAEKSKVQVA